MHAYAKRSQEPGTVVQPARVRTDHSGRIAEAARLMHASAPVQRVIELDETMAKDPAVHELKMVSGLYRLLDKSAAVIRLQEAPPGMKSDVTPVKPWSKDAVLKAMPDYKKGIQYIVNIDAAHLKGLDVDPARAFPEMAKLTIDDEDQMLRPDEASPSLSAYNVILHELGHVRQALASNAYSGELLDELTPKLRPPLADKLLADVAKAYEQGDLQSPAWNELYDFLNSAASWLQGVKDYYQGDAPLAATETLARDLTDYALVWLEYENITTVEHPSAEQRHEPIRHVHGVEAKVGAAREFRETGKIEKTKQVFEELQARNAEAKPADLADLRKLMIINAQQLTKPLLPLLDELLINYRKIEDGPWEATE